MSLLWLNGKIDISSLQTVSNVSWTGIVILMTLTIIFGIFSIIIATRNLATARTPDARAQAMDGLFNAILALALAPAVPIIFLFLSELINLVS